MTKPQESRCADTAPMGGGAGQPAIAVLRTPEMMRFFAANGPCAKQSAFQLITTITPFALLLVAMGAAYQASLWWVGLILAPLAAGLLVRLFIFQHDCGHGSFFKNRTANDIVGHLIGILTMTPYDHWRQAHASHHATSGNLDKRGIGDVPTKTVSEYLAMTPRGQFLYRWFRNPVILIVIGAPINFLVLQRFPMGGRDNQLQALRSVQMLNAALVVAGVGFSLLVGFWLVVAVYLPIIIVASWIGGSLFYVQHQFEDVYWARQGEWNFESASLKGSSYLPLPAPLHWITGNIGFHHVHHLCSRLPNYRLKACHEKFPALRDFARRLSLRDAIKSLHLALWDEATGRLISFRELRAQRALAG